MGRNMSFAIGEFYHLYNRGTEKREIFIEPSDYDRFMLLFYICNSDKNVHLSNLPHHQGRTLMNIAKIDRGEPIVDICAYCLMPNHFHILVREKIEGGISLFMQKLLTAYTMYFNKKNDRTGSLFQGKFKATHANKDEYLKYLISYIHLNPVKLLEPKWRETGISNLKKIEKFLNNYKYSSYADFLNRKRVEEVIVNKKSLPEYFSSSLDFKKTLRDWLEFKSSPSSRFDL